MEFKLQLVVSQDDTESKIIDIYNFARDVNQIEQLGLTFSDSKQLLKNIQENVVREEVGKYLCDHAHCHDCGNKYRLKGHNKKVLNTLFGGIMLESPRYRNCRCKRSSSKSFSPLYQIITSSYTPEFLYIQAKYASLMSYGLTTKLLKDFLPVDDKLNAATVRDHTLKVAEKCETTLGDEQYFFIEGCQYQWDQLPKPNGKIVMGTDGGYLRQWDSKKTNFEVIAGKSMPSDGKAKYFGLAQHFDKKPKRRVYEVLKSQGMQNNQTIEFLSDGADNLRELQCFLNPKAEHILDWFHVSMRFTVLMNYAKGYQKYDNISGDELLKDLESAKWYLWHGHAAEAYEKLECSTWTINPECNYPKLKKFEKALDEMCTYIYRNSPMVVNYSKRWHSGDRISTRFIESTVNCFITKRFAKKQQMQWSAKGAHLLMQIRAKVMNDELGKEFKHWYPGFCITDAENDIQFNVESIGG